MIRGGCSEEVAFKIEGQEACQGGSGRSFQGEETTCTKFPKGGLSRLAHALERGKGTAREEWPEMRSGKREPEK